MRYRQVPDRAHPAHKPDSLLVALRDPGSPESRLPTQTLASATKPPSLHDYWCPLQSQSQSTFRLTSFIGQAQRQLFLDLHGIVCVPNLQSGGLWSGVPIQQNQSKIQVHEVLAAPESVRFPVEVMKKIVGGMVRHPAGRDIVQRLRTTRLTEARDLPQVAVSAEKNDVPCPAAKNQIQQALARLREITPLFVGMLVCDDLDTGSDQINVRVTVGELTLQPFPLFAAEHIGGGTRALPKVSAIEQDDFHPLASGTECVGGVNPSLLAPRTVRRFIEKIEEQSLAFSFVWVVFTAVTDAIIVIVPSTYHSSMIAHRLVFGLTFLMPVLTRQLG